MYNRKPAAAAPGPKPPTPEPIPASQALIGVTLRGGYSERINNVFVLHNAGHRDEQGHRCFPDRRDNELWLSAAITTGACHAD